MQIQVSLSPHALAAADIRAQLDAGLHALAQPGIRVRADTGASGAEALGLAEAYQFIVDCGPGIVAMLPLVTAVLQLSTAILERRGLTSRKAKAGKKARRTPRADAREASASAAVVAVSVNGRRVELPADDRQLEAFIGAVSRTVTSRESVTER